MPPSLCHSHVSLQPDTPAQVAGSACNVPPWEDGTADLRPSQGRTVTRALWRWCTHRLTTLLPRALQSRCSGLGPSMQGRAGHGAQRAPSTQAGQDSQGSSTPLHGHHSLLCPQQCRSWGPEPQCWEPGSGASCESVCHGCTLTRAGNESKSPAETPREGAGLASQQRLSGPRALGPDAAKTPGERLMQGDPSAAPPTGVPHARKPEAGRDSGSF